MIHNCYNDSLNCSLFWNILIVLIWIERKVCRFQSLHFFCSTLQAFYSRSRYGNVITDKILFNILCILYVLPKIRFIEYSTKTIHIYILKQWRGKDIFFGGLLFLWRLKICSRGKKNTTVRNWSKYVRYSIYI